MKPSDETNFKVKGGDEGRILQGESVNDLNQILAKDSTVYAAGNATVGADHLGHHTSKDGGEGCGTIRMARASPKAEPAKGVAANGEDASKRMQ